MIFTYSRFVLKFFRGVSYLFFFIAIFSFFYNQLNGFKPQYFDYIFEIVIATLVYLIPSIIRRHRLVISHDNETLEYCNLFGQKKSFKWGDIKSVKFSFDISRSMILVTDNFNIKFESSWVNIGNPKDEGDDFFEILKKKCPYLLNKTT